MAAPSFAGDLEPARRVTSACTWPKKRQTAGSAHQGVVSVAGDATAADARVRNALIYEPYILADDARFDGALRAYRKLTDTGAGGDPNTTLGANGPEVPSQAFLARYLAGSASSPQ